MLVSGGGMHWISQLSNCQPAPPLWPTGHIPGELLAHASRMGWVQFRSSVYIGGMLNMVEKDSHRIHVWLGGGFKDFLCIPRSLGKWSYLTSIFFANGLKPPTRWYIDIHECLISYGELVGKYTIHGAFGYGCSRCKFSNSLARANMKRWTVIQKNLLYIYICIISIFVFIVSCVSMFDYVLVRFMWTFHMFQFFNLFSCFRFFSSCSLCFHWSK